MVTPIDRNRLERALRQNGAPSSDFDLNPAFRPQGDAPLRPAGVLIALREGPEGLSVLLTKRSSALKHHPGQIAFPGGRVDDSDTDPVAAALREAHEEIGLPPDNVEVFGEMPTHETVTRFEMHPVLGWIRDDFEPILEIGEVSELFEVPLAHVLDPGNFQIQSRQWRGQKRSYFVVPYGPYYIWGATARILRALADRVQQ